MEDGDGESTIKSGELSHVYVRTRGSDPDVHLSHFGHVPITIVSIWPAELFSLPSLFRSWHTV
jgi:hypothetical protein